MITVLLEENQIVIVELHMTVLVLNLKQNSFSIVKIKIGKSIFFTHRDFAEQLYGFSRAKT